MGGKGRGMEGWIAGECVEIEEGGEVEGGCDVERVRGSEGGGLLGGGYHMKKTLQSFLLEMLLGRENAYWRERSLCVCVCV